MKQPRVIQRFSSLMLASLLLFMAVWGYGSVAQQQTLAAKKAVAEHAKAGKAKNPTEAQLSTAQFEAVVTPAIQLGDSGQVGFSFTRPYAHYPAFTKCSTAPALYASPFLFLVL